MKPYIKKKLLKQKIKKHILKKNEILETVKIIDKRIAKLESKVYQIDHPGGSYEVVENVEEA